MASKIGNVFNRFLNAVGLVDEDEEPRRSSGNQSRSLYDDDDYGSRRYEPSSRRTDARRTSGGTTRTASPRSTQSSSKKRSNDTYSEWNTAAKHTNRYADSIYDDDTTIRGDVEGKTETARSPKTRRSSNTDRYGDRYGDTRSASRNRTSYFDDEPAQEKHRYSDNGYDDPRPSRNQSRDSRGTVIMCEIHTIGDCKDVIYAVIANKTVVFSLADLDDAMIRRIVDVLSGAACALDATIRRTSEFYYLMAPATVEVDGSRRI